LTHTGRRISLGHIEFDVLCQIRAGGIDEFFGVYFAGTATCCAIVIYCMAVEAANLRVTPDTFPSRYVTDNIDGHGAT
jgi:hypothetical protein